MPRAELRSFAPSFHRSAFIVQRSFRAFSLVELLTVIGIIAVLIAILLPALTKARQSSNMVVCRSNLRQIYQAGIMFATEHHGFMQIAGKINGAAATPSDMGDPQQTAYAYFSDQGAPRPEPFPIAMGPYLGSKIRSDSSDDLVADFQSATCLARKVFTCPSQHDVPLGTTVSGETDGWYGPKLPISYAYNEGVLGYEYQSQRRWRGQFSKAQPSSDIMFMTDALPRDETGSYYIAWYAPDTGRWTLADALDETGYDMADQFDKFRHQGKMNVAYFDG
ncbi:MAG TPA: type II secretion system protein, partial [Tepidisphaeraceae bacterium]